TDGPPLSCQSKSSVGCVVASRICHVSSSVPVSNDKAPYLVALVASSVNAIVKLRAALGGSGIEGPAILTLSPKLVDTGARTSPAKKSNGASSQWRVVNRSCARASPTSRLSYRLLKS